MAWEHHTTSGPEDNLYRGIHSSAGAGLNLAGAGGPGACVDFDDNLPDHIMNTNIINCSGLQAHKLSATHLLASPDENRNPLNESTGTSSIFFDIVLRRAFHADLESLLNDLV